MIVVVVLQHHRNPLFFLGLAEVYILEILLFPPVGEMSADVIWGKNMKVEKKRGKIGRKIGERGKVRA
jgi:hypothetical protein